MNLDTLQLAAVLVAVFGLPGVAAVSLLPQREDWPGLQRWALAVGLSVAFWPVLYYLARLVPGLQLGPGKMLVLLAVAAIAMGVFAWRNWHTWLNFDPWDWTAVAVVAVTLLTRYWMLRGQPFPAWSDSLHHTLLTQLVAQTGRLPDTMTPYFPVNLDQYHLGLYSLSGVVTMLTGLPAHSGLLWTAQTLNGLCGVGVYLLLRRQVGGLGAVLGAGFAGLLAQFPAWYVNWGRFTQLSGEMVLLVALVVNWEALKSQLPWRQRGWYVVVAMGLNAGLFLLHFRVAGFYLPVLALVVAGLLWQAYRATVLTRLMPTLAMIGGGSLLLVTPALLRAIDGYLAFRAAGAVLVSDAVTRQTTITQYFGITWAEALQLAGGGGVVMLVAIAAAAALWRKSAVGGLALGWVAALVGIGLLPLVAPGLPALSNLSGILISFYLPFALLVGAGGQAVVDAIPAAVKARLAPVGAVVLVVAGVWGALGRTDGVEPARYWVSAADVRAMQWISTQTAPDAVFGIRTMFWLPTAPHGVDAGYWIPYFTGRDTTTGSMLTNLATIEYQQLQLDRSRAMVTLWQGPDAAVDELRALGVDYVYVGASEGWLPRESLAAVLASGDVTVVYDAEGVTILQVLNEGDD